MSPRFWMLPLLAACGTAEPTAPAAPVSSPARVEAPPVQAPPPAPGAWRAPDPASIPAGPEGDAIRRGLAIATDTARLLPDNVGADLNCTSCHLQGGAAPGAIPWVGADDRYPKYRDRSGKVDSLEDRMNGCFERSMNGTALPVDSEPMQALVAYVGWLSQDVTDGEALEGLGVKRITPPEPPDAERGRAIYAQKCAACHQAEGQGLPGPDGKLAFPPLWGEGSYNVGAGMARLNTAAAFVKWNMPLGQGGTLTDQEAYDVAAFFAYQDRPDFAGKAQDWPKGNKPPDARY